MASSAQPFCPTVTFLFFRIIFLRPVRIYQYARKEMEMKFTQSTLCFVSMVIVAISEAAIAAISIDPIARTFTKTGGAATVLTFGSGTWTASTDSDWISIKPRTSGDAGVSCVYVVAKNMSTDTRVGKVIIDGNVHTVTQTGYDATLGFYECAANMDGTNALLSITVEAGIAWSISTDADWVSFDILNGVGSTTVHYMIAPYAGIVTRTASIRVAGQNFIVTQTGKDVEVSPSVVCVGSGADIMMVDVSALSTTQWKTEINVDWLYVVDGDTGHGDSTLVFACAANESFSDRATAVKIGSAIISIVQDGVDKTTLSVSPTSVEAPAGGGFGSLDVSATPQGVWSANSLVPWINIVNYTGLGDGIIEYVVSPNQTLAPREAEIQIFPAVKNPKFDLNAGLIYWYVDNENHRTRDGNLWNDQFLSDEEWDDTWIGQGNRWIFDGKSKFSLVSYYTGYRPTTPNRFLMESDGFSVYLRFNMQSVGAINRLASFYNCSVYFDELGFLWVAGSKANFRIEDFSLEYCVLVGYEKSGSLEMWAGEGSGPLVKVLTTTKEGLMGENPLLSDFVLGYTTEPSPGYLNAAEVFEARVWCRKLSDIEASRATEAIVGNMDNLRLESAKYVSLNCNTICANYSYDMGHDVNMGPSVDRFGRPYRALACDTNSFYRIDNLRGMLAQGVSSAYHYVSTNVTCAFWIKIDEFCEDGRNLVLRKIHDRLEDPMDLTFSNDGYLNIEGMSAPFEFNKWTMITLVGRGTGRASTQRESGTALTWYVNGREVGQKVTGYDGFGDVCWGYTRQTSSGTSVYVSSHLYLGNFRGAIDDCLLVGRALDSAEVLSLYERTKPEVKTCQISQGIFSTDIAPSNITITAVGGLQRFDLSVGPNVAWAAESNVDWLTIPSGTSGSGSASISVNVAANPRAESRVGTITVAGLTLTVRQEPLWSEVENDTPFPPAEDGGYGIITVTTEGNAAWQAVSDASWLTIIDDGDHYGTDAVMWAVDPYTDTTRSRTATIRVADHLIHVTQRGYELSVEPRSKTASSTGETGQIYVNADSEVDIWDVIATEPWITITSGATGAGSKAVTYTLDDNTSGATRTGSILIGGIEYVITQTAKVNLNTTAVGHGTIVGGGEYEANDVAQLVAIADSGYVFSSWGGDVFGVTTNLTVTMDRTKAVTATFIPESAAQQIAKDRGAQGEGLYTRDQIHALEMENLVLDVDPATGTARVGVRLMESSDLSNPNSWTPVGLSQGNIDIGADGTVGLNVEAKGNAKFFKVVVPNSK